MFGYFKAKSEEEKKSWQSMVLTCMLNGYNKKLSDRIKNKINTMATSATTTGSFPNDMVHMDPGATVQSSSSSSSFTTANSSSSSNTIGTGLGSSLIQNRTAQDIIREKIASKN